MNKVEFDELYAKYENNELTDNEKELLEPYKVTNAIVLAAGFGMRCLPLSRYLPKGLFEVYGEVLIERQIKQLKEAGVEKIIVVVGYLKEKFEYLVDQYGVVLVENQDYFRYNNMSSMYVAKEYFENSYICCSDLYFKDNPYRKYVYDSYYACKYSEEYADEDCVVNAENDYIKKVVHGGANAWYLIGEAYFSKSFSRKFVELMEEEYEAKEAKKIIWDSFYSMHIDQLPMMYVKCSDEQIWEFDTIDDIKCFDNNFEKFEERVLEEEENKKTYLPDPLYKYKGVRRYNSATTVEHIGRLHLNENTFGPSPKCLDELKKITLQDLYEYDMEPEDFLIKAIAKEFSIPSDDIFIHNGSAEIIKSIISISVERGENILVSNPGWSYYGSVVTEKFGEVITYNMIQDDYAYKFDVKDILTKAKLHKPKVIVINTPHNPTGAEMDEKTLEKIIVDNPESLIYLDQAYMGFSDNKIDIRRLIESYTNLIVTGTFSKFYGLANARIGFAFCNSKIRNIFELDLPLFRESVISRRMAAVALSDKEYYERITKEMISCREWFIDLLNSNKKVRVYKSGSNFVLVKIQDVDAEEIENYLRDNGIRVRVFSVNGEKMLRVSIGERNLMEQCYKLIVDCI